MAGCAIRGYINTAINFYAEGIKYNDLIISIEKVGNIFDEDEKV